MSHDTATRLVPLGFGVRYCRKRHWGSGSLATLDFPASGEETATGQSSRRGLDLPGMSSETERRLSERQPVLDMTIRTPNIICGRRSYLHSGPVQASTIRSSATRGE